ncbi:MAG: histidine kinase N-terminal 7TM domain-containing protein [Tenuifilaceae bacterium]
MTTFLTMTPSFLSIIFVLLSVSFILSIGLAIYTLRIHNNKAANTFGILMLIISLWILLKIISLFIFSLETRELVHKINILVIVLIPPFLFLVAAYHTNIPKWFRNKHTYLLFIVPAVIYFFVFISPIHNFLFYDFSVIIKYNIPIHIFKRFVLYHIHNIYNYLLIVSTFIILFKSLSSKNTYFRRQMILFIIGLLIPIIYDALYILGFSPLVDYNLSPVFLSIGNCFLAWSMFGYRFFKILPVARNLIVDNMPDIMIITSDDDNIIDINKSGEMLFNCNKDKVTGFSFYDVFKSYPNLIECYSKRVPLKEISIQKEDQTYYYSISLSPLSIEKRSFANIILLHDITERIKADTQIKRLSTAIEQSPVTIVITDLKGNIEYVNPAFCNITGYTAEEALGNNPRVLKGLTPNETFTDLWKTVVAGQVWKGEFINRKKSGEYYYEEAVIAPIKNDKNDIINFIAIKNDISLRKKAENKIQTQNEELKELNATKDKFFSIIAHDLRSPFNTILGFSDYLVNNIENCEKDEVKLYLNDINKSANQTYRLLENLLEWSRIKRGLIKAKLQNYNLKIIALETELLTSEIVKSKSITLQNNIKEDLYVNCDIEMTRTIMRNLISNALKFTRSDGTVEIEAKQYNKNVEIKIKDNGVGIPSDKIPHLFTIDENITTKGTANESGTGLGLLLCKEFVESQGGRIWVESTEGEGSTFYFSLSQSKE